LVAQPAISGSSPPASRQFFQLDIERYAPPTAHDFDLHAVAHVFAVEHVVEIVLLRNRLSVHFGDDIAQRNDVSADLNLLGVPHSGLIGA
jgi:hypothetical protein